MVLSVRKERCQPVSARPAPRPFHQTERLPPPGLARWHQGVRARTRPVFCARVQSSLRRRLLHQGTAALPLGSKGFSMALRAPCWHGTACLPESGANVTVRPSWYLHPACQPQVPTASRIPGQSSGGSTSGGRTGRRHPCPRLVGAERKMRIIPTTFLSTLRNSARSANLSRKHLLPTRTIGTLGGYRRR